MRNPVNWKDHVVQYPDRYQDIDLGGGLHNHVKAPGEIIQQGTAMNAANFNAMDLSALQAVLMAQGNAEQIRWAKDRLDALEGEQFQVTLTNSAAYPFNNSIKTVALSKNKNKKDYTVLVEVLSAVGGGVGEIRVTDKLLNGFKIEFSGAAKSVVVNCIVQGGY